MSLTTEIYPAQLPCGLINSIPEQEISTQALTRQFAPLSILVLQKKEQAKLPPAMNMCVTQESDSVRSYHYFFNATNRIIQGDKEFHPGQARQSRPKKFKSVTSSANRAIAENRYLQKLKTNKKELFRILMAKSNGLLTYSLVKMLIDSAQENRVFDSLPLPESIDAQTLPKLQNLYEGMRKLNSPTQIPEVLEDLIDFSQLSFDDALKIMKKSEKKFDRSLWENHKTQMAFLIKLYWNDEKLTSEKYGQKSIKEFLGSQVLDKKTSISMSPLFAIFKTIIPKHFPNEPVDIQKKLSTHIFQPAFAILALKVEENMQKRQADQAALIEAFKQECEKSPIREYLDAVSKMIAENKGQIRISCLQAVVKEQKQHSIARFYNLVNYYTAFVNTIQSLDEIVASRYNLPKYTVIKIIERILKKSHIEHPDHYIANQKKSKKNEGQSDESTVDHDIHHEPNVMGYEKKPLSKEDRQLAIDALNVCTDAFDHKKGKVYDLQRAHTLPFPSCFAWKDDKLRTFIQEQINTTLIRLPNRPTFLSSEIFKIFSLKRTEHQQIQELLKRTFQADSETYKDAGQFIYTSLNLTRKFFLRLFSETEMIPDFVNTELDALSEWRMDNNRRTYKSDLANALKALLNKGKPCTEKDVVIALKDFFGEVMNRIHVKSKEWAQAQDKGPALPELLRLVCVYQVEETMRTVLLTSHSSDLSNEVGTSNLSKNTWVKRIVKRINLISSKTTSPCESLRSSLDTPRGKIDQITPPPSPTKFKITPPPSPTKLKTLA